jgi:hypothetical protein
VKPAGPEHRGELAGVLADAELAELGQPQGPRAGCPDGEVWPGLDLDRSRNAGTLLCRLLKRGNPAAAPARWPVRDFDQFPSAAAALTDAHSKTSVDTSPRQGSPRTSWPPTSRLTRVSAARPSFHAFMWLMNDTFDHDNGGVRSVSATP